MSACTGDDGPGTAEPPLGPAPSAPETTPSVPSGEPATGEPSGGPGASEAPGGSGAPGGSEAPGAETSEATEAPAVPPVSGPVTAPSATSTADRTETPPASVVRVVGVAVEDSAEGERIVISTEGGTPGYRLRYVDLVRINDEPLIVEGTAFLELVLESADPSGDQGALEEVAVELLPELPILREVRYAYYLGDEVTYAIGVAEQVPFSVHTSADEIVITFIG